MAVEAGVPVLFGGEVHGDALLLSEFVGTRTGLLRGLVVRSSSGLGGASMVGGPAAGGRRLPQRLDHHPRLRRAGAVRRASARCSRCRWSWTACHGRCSTARTAPSAPIGGRAADLMVALGRRLADELRVRDEVDRRLRLREAHPASGRGPIPRAIREVHADLAGWPLRADARHRRRVAGPAGRPAGGAVRSDAHR